MKTCSKCGASKDEKADFHQDTRRGKPRGRCKLCTNADNVAHAKANPEKHNAQMRKWYKANTARAIEISRESQRRHPEKTWNTAFRGRFNIDFQSIWDAQKGLCACCGGVMLPRGRDMESACVDHDHKCCPGKKSCGKCVRGLIHWRCNMALGFVKDDRALLRDMAAYLERWETRPASDAEDPSMEPMRVSEPSAE